MDLIQYRECPFASPANDNLARGWRYSREVLARLNEKLSSHLGAENLAIAVAGSFGRFEAGPPSDLDFFVITSDETVTRHVYRDVTDCAKELNLKLPNPDGVFSAVLKFQSLIDNIGNMDESPAEQSQRLLLILETQPIYNERYYKTAIDGVLEQYLYLHRGAPHKEAVILLNDLIRYFRYICVNYQFNFWHNEEKWVLRNIKLRHSRVVMYAGLLFLIMNASKYGADKIEYIKSKMPLTPLERIASVLEENGRDPATLLSCYDRFLGVINRIDARKSLIDIEYADRYDNDLYGELKKNSDLLQSFLTNFVLDMRGNWSDKAFEYLIL